MCLRTLALCCLIQVSVCTASETVVFKKRPSQPGDSSQQTIQCDLDLKMSIRQAGQVVQAQEQGIQRKQLRELTILSVGESAPTKARVAYRKSSVALRTTDQPAQLADQPVTGKTYLVIRDGDRLTVTYADGEPPSDEELAIVMQNMESFGLPNPIANFFGQRTMKVNETIKLPSKVARELLGFPDTVRNITEFHLRLRETRDVQGVQCAVFDIKLLADNGESDSLKMDLTGTLVLEVETCRTVGVTLSGPVGAMEVHGPPSGQFEVASEGNIKVAVRANYGASRR